jgi:zinc D-Ala-D-Ala dipeptidase
MKYFFKIILILIIFNSCSTFNNSNNFGHSDKIERNVAFNKVEILSNINQVNDTTFVDLKLYSADFVYDMKYATANNFLKTKVYDCGVCLLRLKIVKALIAANSEFIKKGYRIKLFDCYRPLDVQKKMWEIVSNPNFVADPKRGSIHNRGGAIDISLVDKEGNELEMGTDFDFFGEQASHNYVKFSKKILKNRKLLKETMVKNGFDIFESEWWHYNLKGASKYSISNFKWDCN